jgi:hypothetical protein
MFEPPITDRVTVNVLFVPTAKYVELGRPQVVKCLCYSVLWAFDD